MEVLLKNTKVIKIVEEIDSVHKDTIVNNRAMFKSFMDNMSHSDKCELLTNALVNKFVEQFPHLNK